MHRTKLSKTKRLLRYWDCKSHSKKFKFICSMTPSKHFSPWPLERIAEVYPGRDGHTRVAKVACGIKTVVRPINKLISLEINS